MTLPATPLRFGPLASGLHRTASSRILLVGRHQPSLLRRLDGWSRRCGRPNAFLIQFNAPGEPLHRFARDSFDLAVVEALDPSTLAEQVQQLVRVARQGLIMRR
ncbi:class I SAM-dependent methyltransferase [Stutzerimonas urumqiensis]|uniref:class I SAM-dependent methyltransferase n=1 Tax=Stutzerimonas urumqiensis TaxID=638269 RepID=UPI000EAF0170|nr:class I SAM-dependent methyltransferase [Stutzerimonas urumqiensis]